MCSPCVLLFLGFFLSFSRLMTSRGKFGKSFLLGSPATPMTSSHCWRRRPISSPSAPCFTRTRSTARRQENSRTRFTRWGTKKVIKANPQSLLGFKISLLFHLADSFASQRCRWDLNPLIFAAFAPTGWGYLPGIPGVPRALADLPHVVHRDCQFHWRRRRSLGLLSCVSALLNWHQPPAHTRTHAHRALARSFYCVIEKQSPPLRRLWPITMPVWLYFPPVGELLIREELPLCQKAFSDFSGARAELNTVVFWNTEQCLNSKKSLCQCFLYPGTY